MFSLPPLSYPFFFLSLTMHLDHHPSHGKPQPHWLISASRPLRRWSQQHNDTLALGATRDIRSWQQEQLPPWISGHVDDASLLSPREVFAERPVRPRPRGGGGRDHTKITEKEEQSIEGVYCTITNRMYLQVNIVTRRKTTIYYLNIRYIYIYI